MLADFPETVGAADTTGSVAWELENDITGAVKIETEFTTESVAVEQASDTVTVEGEPGANIGAVDDEVAEEADAAVLARAAWCWAARWRFFSLSACPRWRGWRGGDWGGGAGVGAGGREWGAPG